MARTVGLSADSMNQEIESSRKSKVHCGIGHPRRATRTVHCSWCYATPTRDCLGVVVLGFFFGGEKKRKGKRQHVARRKQSVAWRGRCTPYLGHGIPGFLHYNAGVVEQEMQHFPMRRRHVRLQLFDSRAVSLDHNDASLGCAHVSIPVDSSGSLLPTRAS